MCLAVAEALEGSILSSIFSFISPSRVWYTGSYSARLPPAEAVVRAHDASPIFLTKSMLYTYRAACRSPQILVGSRQLSYDPCSRDLIWPAMAQVRCIDLRLPSALPYGSQTTTMVRPVSDGGLSTQFTFFSSSGLRPQRFSTNGLAISSIAAISMTVSHRSHRTFRRTLKRPPHVSHYLEEVHRTSEASASSATARRDNYINTIRCGSDIGLCCRSAEFAQPSAWTEVARLLAPPWAGDRGRYHLKADQ
ncbi:hypothetical protein BD626DRAFT_583179 [Schizophyllum amplum]|uniref:Uncharacterized protein n=1 Tax=Schizophyllum amplum TaxID=97359 RepID=A0A550CGR7_9AGAR|nr:hypothetical protein BD626DRAFT_583179 [Auriculariopsis ampla]